MTLNYVIAFFCVYGVFAMCKDIGRSLKRARKSQEAQAEARKTIEEYEQKEKARRK